MTFEADHLRRMEDAAALAEELLPSQAEELGEIRAEYRDASLCKDRDQMRRIDQEVELRENVHARLGTLWMLMTSAQDTRDETLSKATAAEMQTTIQQEFRRREEQSRQP